MAGELEGKVAAVTGGASGIGRASAEAMLAALSASWHEVLTGYCVGAAGGLPPAEVGRWATSIAAMRLVGLNHPAQWQKEHDPRQHCGRDRADQHRQ